MDAHILYVDDNKTDRELYSSHLTLEGFKVTAVRDGQEAVTAILKRPPDLIMLDYRLGAITGIDLSKQLRNIPAARDIPILVFTNFSTDQRHIEALNSGADDFLDKGAPHDLLISRVKRLLSKPPPSTGYVIISVTSGTEFHFDLSGARTNHWQSKVAQLERERFNADMADLAESIYEYHDRWLELSDQAHPQAEEYVNKRRGWRRQATGKGQDLYKQIFEHDPTFLKHWGAIESAAKDRPDHVLFRFKGPVEDLALPFELINDGQKFWSVHHPLSRQISNVNLTGDTWSTFLKKRSGESIHALLLASDELALEEVQSVAKELSAWSEVLGIKIEVSPSDLTRPVTLKEAEALLSLKNHHMVHYAGHGFFDQRAPELSYLSFSNEDGSAARLTTAGLYRLLEGSAVQFLYLSCCCGAEIGDSAILNVNSYIGLVHAAVLAGVPSVLGYRWPVVELSASRFATRFYQSLALPPSSLEQAVLKARQEIFEIVGRNINNQDWDEGGWDDAWFSPVLVVQNPDYFGEK